MCIECYLHGRQGRCTRYSWLRGEYYIKYKRKYSICKGYGDR
nr:MAG TPA: hypothetical protein [Caudoviricetes sp.]